MEELVNKIVTEVGIPLPTYDYIIRKYKIQVPINIPTENGGVTGTVEYSYYDTFLDALNAIIEWNNHF